LKITVTSPSKSEKSDETPDICHSSTVAVEAGTSVGNGILVTWQNKLCVLTVGHILTDKQNYAMKDAAEIRVFFDGAFRS